MLINSKQTTMTENNHRQSCSSTNLMKKYSQNTNSLSTDTYAPSFKAIDPSVITTVELMGGGFVMGAGFVGGIMATKSNSLEERLIGGLKGFMSTSLLLLAIKAILTI